MQCCNSKSDRVARMACCLLPALLASVLSSGTLASEPDRIHRDGIDMVLDPALLPVRVSYCCPSDQRMTVDRAGIVEFRARDRVLFAKLTDEEYDRLWNLVTAPAYGSILANGQRLQ